MSSSQPEATERIRFLEQQLRDLEQQLRSECSSSVRAKVQHMQQLAAVGKTLQLKDEVVARLNRQVNELQNAYVAERQRADQLQRVLNKGIQGEAQLREVVRTLQQQIRQQQAAFSEATNRFMEQRRRDHENQERLQRSVEQLGMELQDRNTRLEQERMQRPEQMARNHEETDDQEQRCITEQVDISDVEATATPLPTDDTAACGVNQHLEEQLREFERERAQLLEQASDAAQTHRDVSLAHLREREAVLTCPISRDLFDDPVVSECCGKTVSSQAILQALGQSLSCPFCRASNVRLHSNRDMALLVELHRLERSIIGVSDVAAPSSPAVRTNVDAEGKQNNAVPSERSHASGQRNDDGSTRHRAPKVLHGVAGGLHKRSTPEASRLTPPRVPGQQCEAASSCPHELDAYGRDGNDPLVVVVPEVWFELKDAVTRAALDNTLPDSTPLPGEDTIATLQNIVFQTNQGILAGLRPRQLTVFKDQAAYDLNETLDLYSQIGSLGQTRASALIVEVPRVESLHHLTIDQEHASAVQTYRKTAQLLKDSTEVEDVVNVIKNVTKFPSPMRFIVLENSSGTGKTQMAFNLEATEACDVFYVLCTHAGDRDQDVYRAFATRSKTFVKCLRKDMEVLDTGSVDEFETTEKLYVYAFIAAAVRGDGTFQGRATRAQVEEALNNRKQESGGKPFVFFLDEFPRVGSPFAGQERERREAHVQSMRNGFRSFLIPVIISATNGTARNLLSFEERSRDTSNFSDTTPWCVVVLSLPAFDLNEDGISINSNAGGARRIGTIPAGLLWIVDHSRPLFAEVAWNYMNRHRDYGETSEDWLRYLSDMTGYVASYIRGLKARIRPVEFELGQVNMVIGSSCSVDNSYTNLVDGHFACLSELKPFQLDLGGDVGLFQGNRRWRARCVFPPPERDILLHLTLTGDQDKIPDDYEDSDDSDESEEGEAVWRPLNAPLHQALQHDCFRGENFRGTHGTNSGIALETLVAGAVVLASHQDKFCGVKFPAFLGRLLYELAVVGEIDAEVEIPSNHAKNASTIPFLSVPNTEWPSSFVGAWQGSGACFANLRSVAGSDRVSGDPERSECGFVASAVGNDTCILSGECRDDKDALDGQSLVNVLHHIPDDSLIHLVVVRQLQDSNFHDFPAACGALASANLQCAGFYRISKEGELVEFTKLMAAKSGFSVLSGDKRREKGGDKLVLFIEIGEWDAAS